MKLLHETRIPTFESVLEDWRLTLEAVAETATEAELTRRRSAIEKLESLILELKGEET